MQITLLNANKNGCFSRFLNGLDWLDSLEMYAGSFGYIIFVVKYRSTEIIINI